MGPDIPSQELKAIKQAFEDQVGPCEVVLIARYKTDDPRSASGYACTVSINMTLSLGEILELTDACARALAGARKSIAENGITCPCGGDHPPQPTHH
jgi:hypothetical protein